MHSKWVFKHFSPRRKGFLSSLITLWILGILLGVALSIFAANDASKAFLGIVSASPTPYGLLLAYILPVGLAAAIFAELFVWVIYLVVPLMAVLHGFCGMTVYLIAGDAAWLLRPMFLLVGGCTSVLVWWLVFQACSGKHLHRCFRPVLLLSCIVFLIDLFFISPFVGDLTKVLLEGFA